jgi:two-component system sensor histidine kinase CpxA
VRLPNLTPEAWGPRSLTLVARSRNANMGSLFADGTPWLLTAIVGLALSVLLWFALVQGITRSLGHLTTATEAIAEGRFEARIAIRRRDELGQLADSINRMAARLDGLVNGQKRFLGDVAHELCSPLARLQMSAGILEQKAGPETEAQWRDLREELDQMSTLVNELLSFSKASLKTGALPLKAVRLADLVATALQREKPPEKLLEVLVPETVWVRAEPELLTRAIANLLRNAIRYAGECPPIRVVAATAGPQVTLTIQDQGPGVPEAALSKIFDPFYRLDPARESTTGGTGLGLAIVKSCVEACHGTVGARNRQPQGLEVWVQLERAEPGV